MFRALQKGKAYLISIIISIIALGLIITIHELGHFLFAKLFSVGVVSFSLGMGPSLISRVYNNTEYALRILPFGGSCLMAGEELDEADSRDPDGRLLIDGRYYDSSEQFVRKIPWQRFLIIFGGPLFNFLLALLLSIIMTANVGADLPFVVSLEQDMPVAETGLEPGDRITYISIDGKGKSIHLSRDLYLFLYLNSNRFSEQSEVIIGFDDVSEGKEREAVFLPVYDQESGGYLMGIGYNIAYEKLGSPLDVVRYGAYNIGYSLYSALESVKLLVSGGASREDVMGPVRIVSTIDETMDEAADYGLMVSLMSLFNLMIIISVSLGVTNILPIPALDGGRLIFILIELITGHAVPKEMEARVHTIGMAALLLLMIFIIFNDISFLL